MLRLAAVGDIIMGDHPLYLGIGTGSRPRGGLFDSVADVLRASDIALGNLEGPLLREKPGIRWEERIFRGRCQDASLLREAGFNALSVANNHIMHHGMEGWVDTTAALEQASIVPVGTRKGWPTVSVRGERVAMLGYSMRPEEKVNSSSIPYALADPNEILQAVRNAAEEADVVIVSLHWGEEYLDYPLPEQRDLGHALCSAGATVVVGHHPHVLQGVEMVGDSLVAYSLGNFVSDMCQMKARASGVLRVLIEEGRVRDWQIVPVEINQSRPILVDPDDCSRRLTQLNDLCCKLSVSKDMATIHADIKQSLDDFRREYEAWFKRNFIRYPVGALLYILGTSFGRRSRRWIQGLFRS